MEFIPLTILFLGAGLLAMLYYTYVPSAATLRKRLPNRVSFTSVFLTIIIGGVVWFVFKSMDGIYRASSILMLIFSLLLFESLFLLSLRWIKKNLLAVLLSLAGSAIVFWLFLTFPSFVLFNSIIIVATLGAATLMIRLGYIRTKFLFIITLLWVVYDILFVQFILPKATTVTENPFPTFLFPSVTVDHVSLGGGDFMFLVLFTLTILRDFSMKHALVLVASQSVGLLVTGFLLPDSGFVVPFLVIMVPIFFLVYLWAYLAKQKQVQKNKKPPATVG